MKKVLIIALLAAVGWWYFVSSRTLTEERVNAFYGDLERATLERKPDALCEMLADDFESTGTVSAGEGSKTVSQNREQACQAYVDLYQSFDKLGEKMGGMLQLDSTYQIHGITLSPDKKTATVDVSTSMDVAGSVMNIRARSTDTLIRRSGKVLMLKSEGKGSVSGGRSARNR